MADTPFTDGVTPIRSSWLNDVNKTVYEALGAPTTPNQAAANIGAVQNVAVGTTTTSGPGTSASVVNTGTAQAPVLSFTLPQGTAGANGNASTLLVAGSWDTWIPGIGMYSGANGTGTAVTADNTAIGSWVGIYNGQVLNANGTITYHTASGGYVTKPSGAYLQATNSITSQALPVTLCMLCSLDSISGSQRIASFSGGSTTKDIYTNVSGSNPTFVFTDNTNFPNITDTNYTVGSTGLSPMTFTFLGTNPVAYEGTNATQSNVAYATTGSLTGTIGGTFRIGTDASATQSGNVMKIGAVSLYLLALTTGNSGQIAQMSTATNAAIAGAPWLVTPLAPANTFAGQANTTVSANPTLTAAINAAGGDYGGNHRAGGNTIGMVSSLSADQSTAFVNATNNQGGIDFPAGFQFQGYHCKINSFSKINGNGAYMQPPSSPTWATPGDYLIRFATYTALQQTDYARLVGMELNAQSRVPYSYTSGWGWQGGYPPGALVVATQWDADDNSVAGTSGDGATHARNQGEAMTANGFWAGHFIRAAQYDTYRWLYSTNSIFGHLTGPNNYGGGDLDFTQYDATSVHVLIHHARWPSNVNKSNFGSGNYHVIGGKGNDCSLCGYASFTFGWKVSVTGDDDQIDTGLEFLGGVSNVQSPNHPPSRVAQPSYHPFALTSGINGTDSSTVVHVGNLTGATFYSVGDTVFFLDALLASAEQGTVTAVGVTNPGTVTVTRGANGTTKTTHAMGAVMCPGWMLAYNNASSTPTQGWNNVGNVHFMTSASEGASTNYGEFLAQCVPMAGVYAEGMTRTVRNFAGPSAGLNSTPGIFTMGPQGTIVAEECIDSSSPYPLYLARQIGYTLNPTQDYSGQIQFKGRASLFGMLQGVTKMPEKNVSWPGYGNADVGSLLCYIGTTTQGVATAIGNYPFSSLSASHTDTSSHNYSPSYPYLNISGFTATDSSNGHDATSKTNSGVGGEFAGLNVRRIKFPTMATTQTTLSQNWVGTTEPSGFTFGASSFTVASGSPTPTANSWWQIFWGDNRGSGANQTSGAPLFQVTSNSGTTWNVSPSLAQGGESQMFTLPCDMPLTSTAGIAVGDLLKITPAGQAYGDGEIVLVLSLTSPRGAGYIKVQRAQSYSLPWMTWPSGSVVTRQQTGFNVGGALFTRCVYTNFLGGFASASTVGFGSGTHSYYAQMAVGNPSSQNSKPIMINYGAVESAGQIFPRYTPNNSYVVGNRALLALNEWAVLSFMVYANDTDVQLYAFLDPEQGACALDFSALGYIGADSLNYDRLDAVMSQRLWYPTS